MEVARGADGVVASGGYLGDWTGGPAAGKKILSEYMEKGVAGTVWDHTMGIFEQVAKINEGRKTASGV
jgi:hypothetical protein